MAAPAIRDVAGALLGASTVLALLLPTSGQDSNPPVCWNAFSAEVPCEGSRGPLVAVVVAVGVLVLAWLVRSWGARRTRA